MDGHDWADDVLGMTVTWVRGCPCRRSAPLEPAERLTGVRLDRNWMLETPRRTWTTAGPGPVDGPSDA